MGSARPLTDLRDAPPFVEGLALFAAGRFWHAHEAWESLWRDASDARTRQMLQGMIQVAAARYKLTEKNDRAACVRILTRALSKLDAAGDGCDGFDVRAFRDEARRLLATLSP